MIIMSNANSSKVPIMSPGKPVNPNLRKRSKTKKIHVFFENLQNRRVELGYNQLEFGKKIGMQVQTVSRLESGVFPRDPERLVLIADILHVSLDWLFGRESPNGSERQ